MQMITYAAPMSPGRSRVFYCLVADKAKAPKGMKRVMALRPSWLKFANHFQRNEVLDGDNVFLHGQVKSCVASGPGLCILLHALHLLLHVHCLPFALLQP